MKTVLRLCVSVALAGIALGQTKPKDVYGWGKLRWGMTVKQAKAALGPGARESDGKSGKSTRYSERIVIDKLKIGDIEMTASVYTLPDSEKIQEVGLTLPDGVNKTNGGSFEDLRNSLTRKYGIPTRQEPIEERERTTINSATWVFPSTVISLMWIQVKGIGFETLTLQYSATDNKVLNVL
jgi:hypothetical protein